MKISSKQYAQTLFELTQDKSENDIDNVVRKFAEVLKKNKQMKLFADIIKKFSDSYNKENGIVELEVISAREISEEQIEKIKDFVKDKYKARKVLLVKKIDQKIKGGIILKVGDEILDECVNRKLQELGRMLKMV